MAELCALPAAVQTPKGAPSLLLGEWFPLDLPIDTWTRLSREDDRAARHYLRSVRRLINDARGTSQWDLAAASIWLTAQCTLARFRQALAEGVQ